MTDEHPNAEDYRNRAERAEQALAEMAGHDWLVPDDAALCEALGRAVPWWRAPGRLAERAAARIRALSEQLATERANADRLAEAAGGLFQMIAHGDEKHREWLRDAINAHFRQSLAAHNLLRIDG